jgi:hypothetical protein
MEQKYSAFMVFSNGKHSALALIDKSITFEDSDPILNQSAKLLSAGETEGLLIIFGLRNIAAFEYRERKLIKVHRSVKEALKE